MSSVRTPSRPSETTGPKDSVADKLSDKSARPAQTKQVRLKLVYIDFWSAVKFSFLIAAAVGVVIFVAVLLVWTVLTSTGVFDQISTLLKDVSGNSQTSVTNIVSFAQVMGFTLVIAALNVVVGTVLGAIACVLYNLSVKITGGILVGFKNG
jgi:ABC-type sugar transport system permease subunit